MWIGTGKPGKPPCRQCQIAKVKCVYPPNSAKVVVPELYIETLQRQISAYNQCLREAIPNETIREEVLNRHGVKHKRDNLGGNAPNPRGGISTASPPPFTPRGFDGNVPSPIGSRSPTTSNEEMEYAVFVDEGPVDVEGYNCSLSLFLGDLGARC